MRLHEYKSSGVSGARGYGAGADRTFYGYKTRATPSTDDEMPPLEDEEGDDRSIPGYNPIDIEKLATQITSRLQTVGSASSQLQQGEATVAPASLGQQPPGPGISIEERVRGRSAQQASPDSRSISLTRIPVTRSSVSQRDKLDPNVLPETLEKEFFNDPQIKKVPRLSKNITKNSPNAIHDRLKKIKYYIDHPIELPRRYIPYFASNNIQSYYTHLGDHTAIFNRMLEQESKWQRIVNE